MRHLLTLFCLAIAFGAVVAKKAEASPKEAKTRAEILKWVESAKGFGTISTAEFKSPDQQLFIVWYNPYSGRAACHVHGYVYDAKKAQWVRQFERVVAGSHRVSVEVGALLTIRDVNGAVVYKAKEKD
jgi:hypothetical protein